jgi:hypothetical protein
MMPKRILIAAAMLWGAMGQPALAEVVVVQGNNFGVALGALPGFDYSLGSLDQVTLTISGTENRSGFVIGDWPESAPATANINWSIDGTSNFTLYEWPRSAGSIELASFAVPIAGASQESVSDDDRLFEMWASGEATFSLDPTLIPQLGSSGFNDWDIVLSFFGPGFYDGSDVTFSSDQAVQPISLGPVCFGGAFQGEELCNFFSYTLSYGYTPQAAAVPEPSTWMMLLLGFGAAGVTLRRKKLALA